VTLILETPGSDIHQCPGCGAPCAVERGHIHAAAQAGQKVSIACHKCDEVFRPDHDNRIADHDRGALHNRYTGLPHSNTRIGLCTGCGGRFSLQPLAADERLLVECPHCAQRMAPDEVGRADARGEILAAALASLPPARAGRRWTRWIITLSAAGMLIAGIALVALERVTPDLARMIPVAATPAPRIAVHEAGFRPIIDAGVETVLVTVTLANLGTAAGAPERVVVKLLDAEGNMIMRRPIAAREMTLQPGTTRTLVSRMNPPAPVADLLVELVRARSGD